MGITSAMTGETQMAQVVQTNIFSVNAQRNLAQNSSALQISMQRLSSGMRINSAKDDAAGLGIATGMTSQITGMNQAIRNANDAQSYAQTAESSLVEVTTNLQRIRELAVQSANGIYGTNDRANMQKEVVQLRKEISRILKTSNFNKVALFASGGFAAQGLTVSKSAPSFQIGAYNNSANRISLSSIKMSGGAKTGSISLYTRNSMSAIYGKSAGLTPAAGGNSGISVSSQTRARSAIDMIDTALTVINNMRADFGAISNRFDSVVRNLQVNIESTSASRSRIQDTDFASETAALTRSQILQQAGIAMLSQANSQPQQVLSLLR
ncbi:flagellin [Gammaproteobacteria bacterium]